MHVVSMSSNKGSGQLLVWCKFSYILYVPAVCKNKNYENLDVQIFYDIKYM